MHDWNNFYFAELFCKQKWACFLDGSDVMCAFSHCWAHIKTAKSPNDYMENHNIGLLKIKYSPKSEKKGGSGKENAEKLQWLPQDYP